MKEVSLIRRAQSMSTMYKAIAFMKLSDVRTYISSLLLQCAFFTYITRRQRELMRARQYLYV